MRFFDWKWTTAAAAHRKDRVSGILLLISLSWGQQASAQFVSDTEIRPFVIGIVPVVGSSGRVGGISIDAKGAVSRSDIETLGRLREARLKALGAVDSDIAITSPM